MEGVVVQEEEMMAVASQAVETKLSRKQAMAVARTTRAFAHYGEARLANARIAKAIVSLRLSFDKDGKPDYRGDSPQYRSAVASVYETAIADPEEREQFKVAIRYWIGKEFAARVESKEIPRKHLQDAGILKPLRAPAQRQAGTTPARPARPATNNTNGSVFTLEGEPLTVEDVLRAAETAITEHVQDIGLVPALRAVERELKPIIDTMRIPEMQEKVSGRRMQSTITRLLGQVLDAATLAGVDVEDAVAQWETTRELATA